VNSIRTLFVAAAVLLALRYDAEKVIAQITGPDRGEILMTGTFSGDGPWARATGQWLLLGERNDGFELRQVVATASRIAPVCGETFSVDVPSAEAKRLLIRGFPALKAGPVVTAFAGSRFLLPGDTLHLPLGTNRWNLHAFGTVRPSTVAAGLGEAEFVDYQIQMIGQRRAASVFSIARVDNNRPPRILWVGDLDSDQVPDVFYSHGRRYVLMLSRNATDGGFVIEVASFETRDC
jgi:hypothetical protein